MITGFGRQISLGSFLGQYIGWRGAFFAVVPLAVLTLAWLFARLPLMPSERSQGGGSVFRVLLLGAIHAPGGPGLHRRVDIAERPLVGRYQAVGVLIPFA